MSVWSSLMSLLTSHAGALEAAVPPVTTTPAVTLRPVPECGITLLRGLESLALKAYLDTAGIPTLGYGHTKSVKLGDTCTVVQAEAWLREDCAWAWEAIVKHVRVPLTSSQSGALLSFVFNLGEPQFLASSVYRALQAQNYGINISGKNQQFFEGFEITTNVPGYNSLGFLAVPVLIGANTSAGAGGGGAGPGPAGNGANGGLYGGGGSGGSYYVVTGTGGTGRPRDDPYRVHDLHAVEGHLAWSSVV